MRGPSASTTTASITTARQSRPYAPAFMRTPPPAVPGIADANSKPPSPRRARDEARPRSPRRRPRRAPPLRRARSASSPAELQDECVDAVVVHEQVRAEADRLDRVALLPAPSAATRAARRASPASRRTVPGRPCRSSCSARAATCSSTLIGCAACRLRGRCRRRRPPAARRPDRARRRERSTPALDRRRPAGQHAAVAERIDDELAGDAGDRLLACRVDVGDGHVVGGGSAAASSPARWRVRE